MGILLLSGARTPGRAAPLPALVQGKRPQAGWREDHWLRGLLIQDTATLRRQSRTRHPVPGSVTMGATDGIAHQRLRIDRTPTASILRPALNYPLFLFVTKEFVPICLCLPGRPVH